MGNLDEAIRILRESKELDSDYPGLAASYSEQLVSIYEKQADTKAYKEELLYYVLKCPQRELTYIRKLKKVCTDKEWEQYRGADPAGARELCNPLSAYGGGRNV